MLSSLVLTRRRRLVALAAALLFFPLVSGYDFQDVHGTNARAIAPRQLGISLPDAKSTSASDSASTNSATSSASSVPSSASTAAPTSAAPSQPTSSDSAQKQSSAAPSQSSSASSNAASSTPAASITSTPSQSTPSASPSSTPSSTQMRTQVSSSLSTNSDGQTSVIYYTVTAPVSSTPSASQSASGNASSGSSGVSTSTIIGLSVAGGISLIGLIAFVVWKIGRKRFSDDFDDGDAIKWPDLNEHGESPHALPTQRTGGAGFETTSEVNLVRPDSRNGSYASSTGGVSDMYPVQNDPYAVPPLPHLNPNAGTPYRDDPGAGYYDPYSGPVPNTIEGEAIPMTQIPARSRSPMPGGGAPSIMEGRRSPGPQAAFAAPPKVMSPGPGFGGRSSPAPGGPYGGRASPAPSGPYGGRMSPGPQAAYGAPGGYGP